MDFPVLGTLLKAVSEMGALGVSIIVVWALMSERLIPVGRLDDMKKDRDRAIEAAVRSDERADHLTDVYEKETDALVDAIKPR